MKDELNIISDYFKLRNEKFNRSYDCAYGKKFRNRHIRNEKNGLIGLSIDKKLHYKVIGKNKRLYTSIKTLRNILTDEEIATIHKEILKKNARKDEINDIIENLKSVSTERLIEMLDEIKNFDEDYSFCHSTIIKIYNEIEIRDDHVTRKYFLRVGD